MAHYLPQGLGININIAVAKDYGIDLTLSISWNSCICMNISVKTIVSIWKLLITETNMQFWHIIDIFKIPHEAIFYNSVSSY